MRLQRAGDFFETIRPEFRAVRPALLDRYEPLRRASMILLIRTLYVSFFTMPSRSSSADAPVHPDALSEVLQDLHLSDVSSGYGELAHPWGISFAAEDIARFHFVVSGACWMASSDGEWVALQPGDAVLLPPGERHVLSSTKNGATTRYDDVQYDYVGENTFRMRGCGDGKATTLFCCCVAFKDPTLRPLLALMPPMLLFRSAAQHDPVLPVLLDTMATEVRSKRLGSATVLSRLADVVITRVVRAWAEDHKEDATGWLAAIHDPKIGRALAAIHREPGRDWSIKALSEVACVSRSVFTERFAQLVTVTPARYITQLRMHIACGWLRTDRATVAQVSARLGYESETSFSRAFKRHIGMSPSDVRRSAGH